MFSFIKGKVEIDMEPTLDLPNASNIPNTMAVEGFYN